MILFQCASTFDPLHSELEKRYLWEGRKGMVLYFYAPKNCACGHPHMLNNDSAKLLSVPPLPLAFCEWGAKQQHQSAIVCTTVTVPQALALPAVWAGAKPYHSSPPPPNIQTVVHLPGIDERLITGRWQQLSDEGDVCLQPREWAISTKA